MCGITIRVSAKVGGELNVSFNFAVNLENAHHNCNIIKIEILHSNEIPLLTDILSFFLCKIFGITRKFQGIISNEFHVLTILDSAFKINPQVLD